MQRPHHRAATPQDAPALAELINMAGEGMPLYLWQRLAAPGEDPWEIGRQRARRESGSFSYRNASVREEEGRVVAALIGYPLTDIPQKNDYASMPPMFVPLQKLEDLAHGTWYVNALATRPECRGKGYGAELLAIAESLAAETGRRGMSIIVADGNPGALRLYRRAAYREIAREAMASEGWHNAGEYWILLTKAL